MSEEWVTTLVVLGSVIVGWLLSEVTRHVEFLKSEMRRDR